MKFIFVMLLPAAIACNNGRRISNVTSKKVFNDSTARVYSLDESTDRELAYYITPAGKKILLQKNHIAAESVATRNTMETSDSVTSPLSNHVGAGDLFGGTIRVTPKTSYSTKTNEKFRTIAALYRKIESNDFMKGLGIGNKEERVEQEDRNVIIAKAYLYTITIEDDNDMHLLIGNTPVYKPGVTRVFNAEISGVPPNGTADIKKHIKDLREKAIDEMVDIPLCGHVGFLQSNRRISIRGSLFFDSHHATKPAKCREVEGESAWEIHPVWDITFQ